MTENIQPVSYFPYFTHDEYENLLKYKHVAPKTTIEIWAIVNVYSKLERLLP